MCGGIPFISKVTLLSACSRVVCGRQPDSGILRPRLQESGPLEAHILSGSRVDGFLGWICYFCLSKDTRNEWKPGFLENLGMGAHVLASRCSPAYCG